MNADEKHFNKLVKQSKKNGLDWLEEMMPRQNIVVASKIIDYIAAIENPMSDHEVSLTLNSVKVTKISESEDDVIDAENSDDVTTDPAEDWWNTDLPSEQNTSDATPTDAMCEKVVDEQRPTGKDDRFFPPDLNAIRDGYPPKPPLTTHVSISITKPDGTTVTIDL